MSVLSSSVVPTYALSRFAKRKQQGELPEVGQNGVLAFSSGNHAQAMSLASALLGIEATILMPEDAPRAKLEATRAYGAKVVTYDRFETTREELGEQMRQELGLTLIPPYDHPDVLCGQGTAALEFFEQCSSGDPLRALIAPLGGGGLLSGCALVCARLDPACAVFGAEPKNADDGARSLKTGEIQTVHNPDTIADGARTPSLGALTFPIIQQHARDILTISEQEIVEAMRWLFTRVKLVVEPTGALAAAAALRIVHDYPEFEGERIGVVLSGGNVDPQALARYLG